MFYSIDNIEKQVDKIQERLQIKEIVNRDLSLMTENNLIEIKTAVTQAECMQGKITENCLAAVKLSTQKFTILENKLETFHTGLKDKLTEITNTTEQPKLTKTIETSTNVSNKPATVTAVSYTHLTLPTKRIV